MDIKLPFTFTVRGKGWKNTPISVTLEYKDGSLVKTQVLTRSHVKRGAFIISESPASGYYVDAGDMIRVTNITEYDGHDFLKKCPSCGNVKTLSEFGESGRYTDGQRDQSECNDCRGVY